MKRLSLETVIAIHSELIAQSGGLDGIRDNNLLDQSINSPYHTFGGEYLYPTLQAMAAHLAFSLIKNHPFLDGNKRIGILSMLVFLDINSLPITCTDDELVTLGLGLADSSITEPDLIDWIISHS
jgi:death-on-curing protein